jgi:hypothetical protein
MTVGLRTRRVAREYHGNEGVDFTDKGSCAKHFFMKAGDKPADTVLKKGGLGVASRGPLAA